MGSEELQKEIQALIKYMKENFPKHMSVFGELVQVVEGKGYLDTKTKELITIALAVKAECEWCIEFHVKKALEAGAKPEEIIEAAWVAVLMGGGPSLMYIIPVLKALGKI